MKMHLCICSSTDRNSGWISMSSSAEFSEDTVIKIILKVAPLVGKKGIQIFHTKKPTKTWPNS